MAKTKTKNKKTDITVIIPVLDITEDTKILFDKSIKSVADQFVRPDVLMIVVPKGSDALTHIKNYDFAHDDVDIEDLITIIENDGETDFASQLNLGVSKIKTKWFTLLESDDEFSKIWIRSIVEYRGAYGDVDMFLPIVIDVDEKGAFLGLTNEAVWAQEFSDERGILNETSLLAYQNFNFDGMAMNKEVYEEMGGVKSSIKLTFIYEFLLRLTYNSTRIMTIPRFGYKHINQRVGSLFHNYKNELTSEEARWWMQLAKREYYHIDDRKITYEQED